MAEEEQQQGEQGGGMNSEQIEAVMAALGQECREEVEKAMIEQTEISDECKMEIQTKMAPPPQEQLPQKSRRSRLSKKAQLGLSTKKTFYDVHKTEIWEFGTGVVFMVLVYAIYKAFFSGSSKKGKPKHKPKGKKN
mmetsp:Transcript_56400/g.155753  ORF Transcript_56400/g.155753 Transcript_56400/m.155753 type:complete len:136 (-) Transcript_56400:821-1228(-)